MKKLMAVFILVLVVMLCAAPKSEAACQIYGKIVYSGLTGGTTYIVYVAPNSGTLPTFYYYFSTVDPEVISTLNAAQAGNLKVVITAGATTICPTSGLYRPGGTITNVGVYSLY